MTEEILNSLTELCIENLHGQGQDSGTNMQGKKNGVKSHIMKINQRAFFIAHVCHILNLVTVNAVKGTTDIVKSFSFIQAIFFF